MSLRRGFTLLEVVVALAILGVSLVAILQISAQAVNSHVYAKKLTIATLLARGKMVDLEQELMDQPLPADDTEDSGDFSDDGWAQYRWRSKIVVPKTNGLTPEQLFGAMFNLPLGGGGASGGGKSGAADLAGGATGLLSSLFGASGAAAGPGGLPGGGAAAGAGGLLAAMGPMAGMASQHFTQMVDTLQRSVREVHLTVSWKEGRLTESIDLVTHVVSLGPGSDRNGGAGAPGSQAAGANWVRADTGAPITNPQPGPGGQGMVDPGDGAPLVTAEQWTATHPGAAGGAMGTPRGLPPGGFPRPPMPLGSSRPGSAGFR
jgi:general secretion pathway protein I